MKLSPREEESLLTHQVGFLAQKRLARGIRLNYVEAVGLVASQLQELIRCGDYSVMDLMQKGTEMLGVNQVMPGVEKMINEVQVEGTFPDGTKLVTVHHPISHLDGDLELALYGSFLPVPSVDIFTTNMTVDEYERLSHLKLENSDVHAELDVEPGEVIVGDKDIVINENRSLTTITVTSLCDRPIQVGSHFPFTEANKYLQFDRGAAYGKRLNIAAGTAVRFEPGETRRVTLTDIGGNRIVRGGNGICDGAVHTGKIRDIIAKCNAAGFSHLQETEEYEAKPCIIPRQIYCRTFGPTTGDKVRLGDTCLLIMVEKDFTVYGDECKFGGGKVLREGQGQAALATSSVALDTVITNALIVDAVTGIIKADIGIKDGKIVGIGKAGNPDVMNGVDKNLVVGVGTEVIAAEGLIVTAGAIDCHVHFICPQLSREAIASGITTLYGGGTGPATGTCATTCTPSPNHIRFMIESTDAFPLNFAFTGKGNTSNSSGDCEELREQILAGAVGLKLHEDWGSTPAAIDTCLGLAEQLDVQVTIHTDTLNESCCVEQTIAAFKGRTIHTYHTEGAGGGHAPDILRVCGHTNVLPSSTNPTMPFTRNTIDEHLDMLMVCHHLDKDLKEDMQFAESRIRAETIAAEDVLHDMGAISILSSDSQAMGRIGEVITRTWQTADKMKRVRGPLTGDDQNADNLRVRRYIAKYTINPAVAGGMSSLIGSVEVGKLADLVLWQPAFFGAKPDLIVKGGQIAWAQMGMPNASIPTPEPVKQRKQFGAYGSAVGRHSVVFVSKASLDAHIPQRYGIKKDLYPISNCRNLTKADMILNDYLPHIKVDPQTYKVYIKTEDKSSEEDWELVMCPPSSRLPLGQRYFLF